MRAVPDSLSHVVSRVSATLLGRATRLLLAGVQGDGLAKTVQDRVGGRWRPRRSFRFLGKGLLRRAAWDSLPRTWWHCENTPPIRPLLLGFALCFALSALAQKRAFATPADAGATDAGALDAHLRLVNLWSERGLLGQAALRTALTQHAQDPALRAHAETLLESLPQPGERHTAIASRLLEQGFITAPVLLGPVPRRAQQATETASANAGAAFFAEGLAAASSEGVSGPVRWRERSAKAWPAANLDLGAYLTPSTGICALLAASITLEADAAPVQLSLGGAGSLRLWLNGTLRLDDDTERGDYPYRYVVVEDGEHQGDETARTLRVLVERCGQAEAPSATLRLTRAEDGAPVALEALGAGRFRGTLDALPPADAPPANAPPSTQRAQTAAGAPVDQRAFGIDKGRLAAFLLAAEPSLSDRAEAFPAVEGSVASKAAAGAANLVARQTVQATRSREVQTRLLRTWQRTAPQDPALWLALGEFYALSYRPSRAVPYLRAVLNRAPRRAPEDAVFPWPRGTVLNASAVPPLLRREAGLMLAYLFTEQGLHGAARELVETLVAETPDGCAVLEARAMLARQRGSLKAIRGHEKDLATHCDVKLRLRELTLIDQLNGSEQLPRRALEDFAAHALAERGGFARLATVFRRAGIDDEAVTWLEEAAQMDPADAGPVVALAQAQLSAGNERLASEAIDEALARAPQDAAARTLAERLALPPAADEALAHAPEQWAKIGDSAAGYGLALLEDLEVHAFAENGLGRRFFQKVFVVQQPSGARELKNFPITYAQGRQSVTLRRARVYRDGNSFDVRSVRDVALSEPQVRMYYDQRARVLELPDLKVGDRIELRYRIDDVQRTRVHNESLSLFTHLQGPLPVARREVVVLTPPGRKLAFHLESHGRTFANALQQSPGKLHITLRHVAASERERAATGITEYVPYLHVGSFASWGALTRWYTMLLKPQLVLGARLKAEAQALVEGKTTTEAKVAAIYRYVLEHTRYVALEFGEHGYIPYAVVDVAERGFGDCKDKAALLIALLRSVGIDAHPVMIRTRPRGLVHAEPPSLALFDHAIAYVPELDLFLDGTVQKTGIRELPSADQGAVALIADPDAPRIVVTPEATPQANARHRDFEITLPSFDADSEGSGNDGGRLRLAVDETVVGSSAPALRQHLEAASTRTQRFTRWLQAQASGAQLTDLDAVELSDPERPVRLRYRYTLPAPRPEKTANAKAPAARSADLPSSALENLVATLAPTASARKLPLDLGTPQRYSETRRYRLPAGVRVTALPPDRTLGTPPVAAQTNPPPASAQPAEAKPRPESLVFFQRKSRREGSTVVIDTHFEVRAGRLAPSAYGKLRRALTEVERALAESVTIADAGSGASQASAAPPALRLAGATAHPAPSTPSSMEAQRPFGTDASLARLAATRPARAGLTPGLREEATP